MFAAMESKINKLINSHEKIQIEHSVELNKIKTSLMSSSSKNNELISQKLNLSIELYRATSLNDSEYSVQVYLTQVQNFLNQKILNLKSNNEKLLESDRIHSLEKKIQYEINESLKCKLEATIMEKDLISESNKANLAIISNNTKIHVAEVESLNSEILRLNDFKSSIELDLNCSKFKEEETRSQKIQVFVKLMVLNFHFIKLKNQKARQDVIY